MRYLLLNQTFHPDVVSTAQYLADLALELARAGHHVTVLTGRHAYDDPAVTFPTRERWNGIDIIRIGALRMGKQSRWRRAADFGTFMLNAAWRLARMRRMDVVVALTSPPLISALGAAFARAKRARFVFWVMDLNPDEAIAAGWLRESSAAARALDAVLRFSLRHSEAIIALDSYMKQRLVAKGARPEIITVVPPWSHDDDVRFDAAGRDRFRARLGLDGKFVVMYAGNHSPCNPLDTLIDAARRLRDRSDIHFCFVGGGSEFARLQVTVRAWGAGNVTFIPYRPRAELAGVLSGADLHVVTLGDAFVGILHPCKVYNVMRVGAPILYIGPDTSHITDIAAARPQARIASIRHDDTDGAVAAIRTAAAAAAVPTRDTASPAPYAKATLLPSILTALA